MLRQCRKEVGSDRGRKVDKEHQKVRANNMSESGNDDGHTQTPPFNSTHHPRHTLNSLVLSVVDWQDDPVGIISTADWDLVHKDVISIQDVVEALARLIDPVEAVLVHINGDHLCTWSE